MGALALEGRQKYTIHFFLRHQAIQPTAMSLKEKIYGNLSIGIAGKISRHGIKHAMFSLLDTINL